MNLIALNADMSNRKSVVSTPHLLLNGITNTLSGLDSDFAVISEVGKGMSNEIVSAFDYCGCSSQLRYDYMTLVWSTNFEAKSLSTRSHKDSSYIGSDYFVSELGKYIAVSGTMNKKDLLFIGTHLPYKKGRIQALRLTCKFVEEVISSWDVDDVVLLGDFNGNQSSIRQHLAEGTFAFGDDQPTTETGFARDNIIVQNYDLQSSSVHSACDLFTHYPISSVLHLEE